MYPENYVGIYIAAFTLWETLRKISHEPIHIISYKHFLEYYEELLTVSVKKRDRYLWNGILVTTNKSETSFLQKKHYYMYMIVVIFHSFCFSQNLISRSSNVHTIFVQTVQSVVLFDSQGHQYKKCMFRLKNDRWPFVFLSYNKRLTYFTLKIWEEKFETYLTL